MAGRDGVDPKEGVDFEWKVNPGTNARTRHFFTRAEKEARKGGGAKKATKAKAKDKVYSGRGDANMPKKEKVDTFKKPEKASTYKLSDTKGGRGDGVQEMARRAIDSAKVKPKKPKDYTYAQWRKMSRTEREKAGLPTSEIGGQMAFKRMRSGVTGKEWQKMSRAEREKAGLPTSTVGGEMAFKRMRSGVTGKDYTVKGYSKGGMVRSRTGHTDHRKGGLFK